MQEIDILSWNKNVFCIEKAKPQLLIREPCLLIPPFLVSEGITRHDIDYKVGTPAKKDAKHHRHLGVKRYIALNIINVLYG